MSKVHSRVWGNFWNSETAESSLKIMKNAFYFISKAFFVLEIFTFLSWLLVTQRNSLIRRLIPELMTSQAGQKLIGIHILSNISRIKCNQAMKFGELIENNVRNIFLKKSYRRWGTKASSITLSVFKELYLSSTLVLIYFGWPPLGHSIKTNFITFQTIDLEIWYGI